MTEVDEIKSPFLRKAIEQRGIRDDQVTSLMIVERYLRHPELQELDRCADVERDRSRSSSRSCNRSSRDGAGQVTNRTRNEDASSRCTEASGACALRTNPHSGRSGCRLSWAKLGSFCNLENWRICRDREGYFYGCIKIGKKSEEFVAQQKGADSSFGEASAGNA